MLSSLWLNKRLLILWKEMNLQGRMVVCSSSSRDSNENEKEVPPKIIPTSTLGSSYLIHEQQA